ncbi:MAG TPA: DUF6455 family protein [Hyphomicrobiales bacterium]
MAEDETAGLVLNARRMTDVMSRVAVDLDAALKRDNGAVLAGAALRCEYCTTTDACDAWIASHEEGEGCPPPDFCPNSPLLRSVVPERRD